MRQEQVIHGARPKQGDVAERPVARHDERRDLVLLREAEPLAPERLEECLARRVGDLHGHLAP